MLNSVSIILVRPRFPENIGMAARAMANMGAGELILVQPERWMPDGLERAAVLATALGKPLLDRLRLAESLREALVPFTLAIGTTARTGGWRRELLLPEQAATKARSACRLGGRAALVFGPEDKGLDNHDIELCTHLVNIPTVVGNSSLNLAQAVLLLLYECGKADRKLAFTAGDKVAWTEDVTPVMADGAVPERPGRGWTSPALLPTSRPVTLEEENLLLETIKRNLIAIDHLPEDNADWFMKTMRRFLRKKGLRRNEFDMFMGICRQITNKIDK